MERCKLPLTVVQYGVSRAYILKLYYDGLLLIQQTATQPPPPSYPNTLKDK